MASARTAASLLIMLALPALASAQSAPPSLTTYAVSPTTIYPGAEPVSGLATTTTISLGFSEKVKVSVKILDASGISIKTLYTSSGVTNPEPKIWDGTNASGASTVPGPYTVLVAATSTATGLALVDATHTIVSATPPPLGEEPPPSPATPFSIPLAAAWNLVSLPVTPTSTAPAAVLGTATSSIDSVWSYDPTNPLADASGWLVYDPRHPEVSNLAALTSGEGYFIHASAPIIVSGTGSLFPVGGTPPARSLDAGWNLVGAFATSSEGIDDAFASIGFAGIEYTALWKFDAAAQSFATPSAVAPGDAFWIYLDAPHPYVPANL